MESRKFEVKDLKGTKRKYEILHHDLKELYAQSLLDSTSFLCVYFPTKIEEFHKDELMKRDWKNLGYFVMSDGIKKTLMRIDEDHIVKNFKVNVINTFHPRWPYPDFQEWFAEAGRMDPSGIFFTLRAMAEQYIEFDDDSTYNVYVLWIIGTYFFRLFDAYPYLDFTGTKRAGKTKTLELIKLLAFNPIMSPDFSGSSIFRLIEGTCATILLDEAETFKNTKSENAQHVRTILIQGFLKDQHAYRTNKDSFQVEPYNLYSPKALAHIHSFDDVLEDRCIQIVMQRSVKDKIQNSYPSSHFAEFRDARCMLYRLAMDYTISIESFRQKADEQMPVSGRERLLWLPILTLAYFFESFGAKNLTSSIIAYAKKNHEERQATDEDENIDYRIARFLETQITEDGSWLKAGELHKTLMKTDEQGNGYKVTFQIYDKYSAQKLGHCLKRLGFPKQHKDDGNYYQVSKETIAQVYKKLGIKSDAISGNYPSDPSDPSVYERKIDAYSEGSDNPEGYSSKTPLDSDTMGGTGVIDE